MTTAKPSLYRVDCELLTITEVLIKDFYEMPPINRWLLAVVGDGYYCYQESEKVAKELLMHVIDDKIKDIMELKESLQVTKE